MPRPRTAEVAAHLRRLIVEGRLGPGAALPTQRKLAETLRVSPVSAHRGIRVLVEEGFLVTGGRRGTRVAAAPPHLCRYAVALSEPPAACAESPHLSATLRAARHVPGLAPRSFPVFLTGGAQPMVSRLVREAEAGRLAGVLTVSDPGLLAALGLDRLPPHVPLASISHDYGGLAPAVRIDLDRRSLIRRAMDLVREAGHTRLAVLWGGEPHRAEPAVEREAARHGIACPARWRQFAMVRHEAPTRHLVRVLFEAPRARRPQALFVGDDSLTGIAWRELEAMGLASGRDPFVVSHANYPRAPSRRRPIRRLGFDAHEWIRVAVAALEAWRPGDPQRRLRLPARTPEEVAAAHRRARRRPVPLPGAPGAPRRDAVDRAGPGV